jgi:hypothetical protein
MSSGGYKLCEPGVWTTLYQGPSFGFVYVWAQSPSVNVRWRASTASIPFYDEGNATIGDKTAVGYGTPTPYVQFDVMPAVPAMLMGS